MSNIVITGIVGVGQYSVPASDAELALTTAGLDALLGTIPNLEYNRVVAMVDNPEGPNGAVGARTLRCLIEEFVYNGDENPLPGVLNALAILIEAKLESDPDISAIGQQYFSLFEASEYFMWGRDAAGGFLYPVVTTDDICVGGSVVPTGKWFQDGDLVLGANAMVGTERLRVVGNAAIEGGAILTEQAATPGGDPGAGKAAFWAKNDTPNLAYFTDDANTEHRLANYFADPRQLFVSKAGSVDGDGSAEAPFLTIQAAVDVAEVLVPVASDTAPVVINIGPGTFVEEVIIKKTQIHLNGSGIMETIVAPTMGVALTFTNATLASLALYRVAYDYAQLVAEAVPVAGPQGNLVHNLSLTGPVGGRTLECLGVKGDAGGGAQTAFLGAFPGLHLYNVRLNCNATYAWYARNCGLVFAQGCESGSGYYEFNNVSYAGFYENKAVRVLTVNYDAADPLGTPAYGLGYVLFEASRTLSITLNGAARIDEVYFSRLFNITLNGTSRLTAENTLISGFVDCNSTAQLTLRDCFITGNVNFEGGITATLKKVSVEGTTTIDAGAGVVTETDCTFAGLVTDASNKLKHAGETRRGKTAYAGPGAGDLAITYVNAFPATATIEVTAQVEDNGSGAATCVIKNGTNLVTGVTFTLSGPCIVNWRAEKVK